MYGIGLGKVDPRVRRKGVNGSRGNELIFRGGARGLFGWTGQEDRKEAEGVDLNKSAGPR